MPIVQVKRDLLFERLEKQYTEKEFKLLCFDFGIELDDVTTTFELIKKEKGEEEAKKEQADNSDVFYKIEVPANRYDLLCLEGLSRALRIFLGLEKQPNYRTIKPSDNNIITMHVKPATKQIRPYVVGAILRNITFTPDSYQSLIDLQEKLHFNICRKRTLVAIGTHDFDTLKPPFIYDAKTPKSIVFQALRETNEMNSEELFHEYRTRKVSSLKEYLPIIENSSVYPVIYDSNNVVLSLPPIINGEHSKVTLNTKNLFIECTATDVTKAKIVLNTIVCMFGEYLKNQFEFEEVKVIYENKKKDDEDKDLVSDINYYPDLDIKEFKITADYINQGLGTKLSEKDIISYLNKMALNCEKDNQGNLLVKTSPTRSDILHAVDVMEDVAIAYGYNNITPLLPAHHTTGGEYTLNSLSDKIRLLCSFCGYTEVLNWALLSKQENFNNLLIPYDDENNTVCVEILNPKTPEFQICRTNLLPGVLKNLFSNIGKVRLPLYFFEVGDVVLLDSNRSTGSRNERRLCCIICNNSDTGFERIHGLIDRIMEQNQFQFISSKDLHTKYENKWPSDKYHHYYSITPSNKPSFFPQRQAAILVDGEIAGYFGILHPQVLTNFGIYQITNCFVSALELNIEVFL